MLDRQEAIPMSIRHCLQRLIETTARRAPGQPTIGLRCDSAFIKKAMACAQNEDNAPRNVARAMRLDSLGLHGKQRKQLEREEQAKTIINRLTEQLVSENAANRETYNDTINIFSYLLESTAITSRRESLRSLTKIALSVMRDTLLQARQLEAPEEKKDDSPTQPQKNRARRALDALQGVLYRAKSEAPEEKKDDGAEGPIQLQTQQLTAAAEALLYPNPLTKQIVDISRKPLQHSYQELENDIGNYILTDNFDKAARLLHIHEDLAQGIISQYQERTGAHNEQVYVRDARHQRANPKGNDVFQSYAAMGLSYFNIALKIAEKTQRNNPRFPEQKAALLAKAHIFFQQIKQLRDPKDAEHHLAHVLNEIIAPFLDDKLPEGHGREKAIEVIMANKDFVSLDQPLCTVATLTKHSTEEKENALGLPEKGAIDVLHIDRPICGITDELREEYQNRKEKPWYKMLPPETQALADDYIDGILYHGKEPKLLPTSLCGKIPGLRNAGEDAVYHLNAQGEIEQIDSGIHLGNLGHAFAISKGTEKPELGDPPQTSNVYYTKDEVYAENKRLTALAIKQLKAGARMGQDDTLLTTELTSPGFLASMLNFTEIEEGMHCQVKEAMEELAQENRLAGRRPNHYNSTLPTNIAAPVSGHHYGGIEHLLKEAKAYIGALLNNLPAALRAELLTLMEKHPDDWLSILAYRYPDGFPQRADVEKPTLQIIQTAIALQQLKNSRSWLDKPINLDMLSSPYSPNMQMTAQARRLAFLLTQHTGKRYIYAECCKSGKDRTGLARIHGMAMAFYHYMTGKSLVVSERTDMINPLDPKTVEKNQETLQFLRESCAAPFANGHHVGRMAARNAPGCGDIRTGTAAAIPGYLDKFKKWLLDRTADLNKAKPKLPETWPEKLRKPKVLGFAGVLWIAAIALSIIFPITSPLWIVGVSLAGAGYMFIALKAIEKFYKKLTRPENAVGKAILAFVLGAFPPIAAMIFVYGQLARPQHPFLRGIVAICLTVLAPVVLALTLVVLPILLVAAEWKRHWLKYKHFQFRYDNILFRIFIGAPANFLVSLASIVTVLIGKAFDACIDLAITLLRHNKEILLGGGLATLILSLTTLSATFGTAGIVAASIALVIGAGLAARYFFEERSKKFPEQLKVSDGVTLELVNIPILGDAAYYKPTHGRYGNAQPLGEKRSIVAGPTELIFVKDSNSKAEKKGEADRKARRAQDASNNVENGLAPLLLGENENDNDADDDPHASSGGDVAAGPAPRRAPAEDKAIQAFKVTINNDRTTYTVEKQKISPEEKAPDGRDRDEKNPFTYARERTELPPFTNAEKVVNYLKEQGCSDKTLLAQVENMGLWKMEAKSAEARRFSKETFSSNQGAKGGWGYGQSTAQFGQNTETGGHGYHNTQTARGHESRYDHRFRLSASEQGEQRRRGRPLQSPGDTPLLFR